MAVPGVVGNPVITEVTLTSMRITWTLPTTNGGKPLDHILLRRSTDPTFPSGNRTDFPLAADATTMLATGLTSQTTWYWRLYAHNADGYSPASGAASAKTSLVPEAPAAPSWSSQTQTTAEASYFDSNGNGLSINGRELQYSTSADFSTGVVTVSVPANTYTLTGLLRNTKYWTRLRMHNSTGWSIPGGVSILHTVGQPPAAPIGYAAYDIAATSATVGTGSLSDNGGAVPVKVRVKISTLPGDAGLIATKTQDAWSPVRFNGLTKGTIYYASEAAYNDTYGGGWGPYGSWVQFKTLTTVPNSPTLVLVNTNPDYATLSWTAPTELNGAVLSQYVLKVYDSPALQTEIRSYTLDNAILSQVVDDLLQDTTYYAFLYTITDKGVGSVSDVVSFTTTGGTPSSNPFWFNIGGTQIKITDVWINDGGLWKKVTDSWFNDAGVWKK